MRLRITAAVFRKEMLDMLRDRRTLFSMTILPTVVFPLLFGVIGKFMGAAERKAESEATSVAVLSKDIPPPFDRAIARSGLRAVVKTNIAQAVEKNETATGFALTPDGKRVMVYTEGTRQASGLASDKLRTALNELRDAVVAERIRAANLPVDTITPFTIKRENVASERRMGGFLLGSMLGYIVILIMFSGGIYPAIDMATGEKERKTLEALLASPARRTELVLGKILACVTAIYLTALLTTSSLFISIASGTFEMKGMEKFLGNIPTDPQTIALTLITLIPVAVMAGALMLAIALVARSSKEAQSYLTPLVMLVIFPSLLGGLPGMELSPTLSLVPILNSSQLLKSILQGDVQPINFFITNLANVVYSAICFWFAVRCFNDEKVLFRT
jgi:sodium transport system permease protein